MSGEEFVTRFVRLRSRTDDAWIAPPELKQRLVADAESRGTNMNEVILEILAKRYRVAFTPAGRPGRASPSGYDLELRLPIALDRAAAAAAGANGRTVPREVIAVIAEHYSLEVPAPPVRRRRRRRTRRVSA